MRRSARRKLKGAERPNLGNSPLHPPEKKYAGWTAERQRIFIDNLSLTGSVGESAALASVSSRSAYMLRNKAGAESFARAWDAALQLSATRLAAIAFDRALHGRTERFYKDGELVMERKMPSDHLLTWLPRGSIPSSSARRPQRRPQPPPAPA